MARITSLGKHELLCLCKGLFHLSLELISRGWESCLYCRCPGPNLSARAGCPGAGGAGLRLAESAEDMSGFSRQRGLARESVLYSCATSALPAAQPPPASAHRGHVQAAPDLDGGSNTLLFNLIPGQPPRAIIES